MLDWWISNLLCFANDIRPEAIILTVTSGSLPYQVPSASLGMVLRRISNCWCECDKWIVVIPDLLKFFFCNKHMFASRKCRKSIFSLPYANFVLVIGAYIKSYITETSSFRMKIFVNTRTIVGIIICRSFCILYFVKISRPPIQTNIWKPDKLFI